MPKVNVYLPDRLAQEVKELGISLSPVCQEALQREVRKMQAIKEVGEDAIKAAAIRLADEQVSADADDRAAGTRAGRAWVVSHATAREVNRLEDYVSHDVWEGVEDVEVTADEFPTMLQALARSQPDSQPESGYIVRARYESAYFWGFVDSALETWNEVQRAQANLPPSKV